MKFCVASPTTKMNASVSTAPIPGRWKPSIRSGCHDSGNRSKVWSIVPMMRPSTHSVIASGTRTSRPVRNTDFRVVFSSSAVNEPRRRRVGRSPAGPRRSTAGGGRCSRAGAALVVVLSELLDAAGAVAAGAASVDAAGAASPDAVAGALVPPEPPRKSVTYQPEPFSWKPAAVTCLRNASFPHSGHCDSGASLIFWSTSFAKPHASHR